jgi:peroxiredoxin
LTEALTLVNAAERGDGQHTARLAALVGEVRKDTTIPEYDRYVLVARAGALEMKPAGTDQKSKLDAYAALDRNLIAEFPRQSEPYASLLALAEDSTDTDAAGQLAVELLDSKAPETVKIGAGRLLDREAMVKTPITFSAQDGEGRPLTLDQFRGKVVVLYVWSGQAKGGASWVQALVAKGSDQTVFVGFNFDSDEKTARLQMAQVAPNSLQVYDPTGFGGTVASTLKLTRNRTVYLVDRNGVLQDVHGMVHFDDKLAQLLGSSP